MWYVYIYIYVYLCWPWIIRCLWFLPGTAVRTLFAKRIQDHIAPGCSHIPQTRTGSICYHWHPQPANNPTPRVYQHKKKRSALLLWCFGFALKWLPMCRTVRHGVAQLQRIGRVGAKTHYSRRADRQSRDCRTRRSYITAAKRHEALFCAHRGALCVDHRARILCVYIVYTQKKIVIFCSMCLLSA